MKISILTIFISTLSVVFCQAQTPSIQWQKSLGGSGSDMAFAIKPTIDGGYIVAGSSNSIDGDVTGNHGNSDFWIVKLNSVGNIQWQKTLGGSMDDEANAIAVTSDGGYVVAGSSKSIDGDVTGNHGNSDFWIVKLNGVGNVQWQKTLGGSKDDYAYSIIATTDGGCITTGYSFSTDGDITNGHDTVIANYDSWVVKLNANGVIQWQKSLGGSGSEAANAIQSTFDKGYIVAGYSFSKDGDATVNKGWTDYWVIKLDSSGTIMWQKSLGGIQSDVAYDIQIASDGGYIIAGYGVSNDGDVSGNHGGADYWIVKLNADGSLQWQKSLGGAYVEFAHSVQNTSDDGYIIAGYSGSNDFDVSGNHGKYDYWLVKLNKDGNMQWQKSFGGSENDDAFSLNVSTDGSFLIAGFSSSLDGDVVGNHGNSDFWIMQVQCPLPDTPVVSKTGNILTSSASFNNQWYKNNILLIGDTNQSYNTQGLEGSYKVRTINTCGGAFSQPLITLGIKEYSNSKIFNVWPNPVLDGVLNIEHNEQIDLVEIYDILGQKVLQTKNTNSIDVSALAQGIYSVKISNKEASTVRKVIVD